MEPNRNVNRPERSISAEQGVAMSRLFLALRLPPAAQQALQAHVRDWRWPEGARCYAPQDWHLTLHFLGAVPNARIESLQTALAVAFAPSELRLGMPVSWDRGLVVLLPRAEPEALRALHLRLGAALRGQELHTDARAYRPHLTLARHAVGAAPPDTVLDVGWPVRDYALMLSTGDPTQRYRVLRSYAAAAGG